MDRRTFLTGLGAGVATAAVGSGGYLLLNKDDGQTEPTMANTTQNDRVADDPPTPVVESRPLAMAFHEHITQEYSDARVFVNQSGQIVMQYSSSSTTGSELTSELYAIIDEYVAVVGDDVGDSYDPKTFAVNAGGVHAIAPVSSVRARVNGNINREAFHQTITIEDASSQKTQNGE